VGRHGDARTRRRGEIEATRYLLTVIRYLVGFIKYFSPLLRPVDLNSNNV
jgi:hypothetical protein